MQHFVILVSAVPEISLEASKFKVGHVTLTTPLLRVICHPYAGLDIAYMHAKCDHSCFSRSGDMAGAHQNLNVFTLPDHAPFSDCSHTWASTSYDQPIYQI